MRTTITIDDSLLKKIKLKSLELNLSVSSYMQDLALSDLEADVEDSKLIKRRSNQIELNFDDLKKQLKKEGLI